MATEKLCECGCQQFTSIAKESDTRFGAIGGQPRRFVHGHNSRGTHRVFSEISRRQMSKSQRYRFSNPSNHPRWKGGEIVHKGYVWLKEKSHPRANRHGYVKRCVLIFEKAHGPIPAGSELHHLNKNKTDDDLRNLMLVTHAEHARIHGEDRGGLNGNR